MCDLGGTRLSEDEELLATGCRCSVRLLGLFRAVGTGEWWWCLDEWYECLGEYDSLIGISSWLDDFVGDCDSPKDFFLQKKGKLVECYRKEIRRNMTFLKKKIIEILLLRAVYV